MKFSSLISVLGIMFLLTTGCGVKKPEGIPEIYPATVKVHNAGTPIAEAKVLFNPTGSTASGSWSVSGQTDSAGIAAMTTSQGEWKENGVPEGEYKISITKVSEALKETPPPEIANDSDALDAFAQEQAKKAKAAPKEIPEALNSVRTSPLVIKIVAGTGGELDVDVSQYK